MLRASRADVGFWGRWVAANSLAELVGLGVAGAVGFAVNARLSHPVSAGATVGLFVLFVALGALEGAVVGCAQFLVLRRRLHGLRSWVSATVAGAAVAWALGMLPSTLIDLTGSGAAGPPPELSDAAQTLLAVPLGLVAGPILAFPQWLVLRRYLRRAAWWLPANALAWAVGMPLVFAVAGGLPPGASLLAIAAAIALALAAAGAAVGAVHGLFLLWLTAPG